jgi:hypothetical protein
MRSRPNLSPITVKSGAVSCAIKAIDAKQRQPEHRGREADTTRLLLPSARNFGQMTLSMPRTISRNVSVPGRQLSALDQGSGSGSRFQFRVLVQFRVPGSVPGSAVPGSAR